MAGIPLYYITGRNENKLIPRVIGVFAHTFIFKKFLLTSRRRIYQLSMGTSTGANAGRCGLGGCCYRRRRARRNVGKKSDTKSMTESAVLSKIASQKLSKI